MKKWAALSAVLLIIAVFATADLYLIYLLVSRVVRDFA